MEQEQDMAIMNIYKTSRKCWPPLHSSYKDCFADYYVKGDIIYILFALYSNLNNIRHPKEEEFANLPTVKKFGYIKTNMFDNEWCISGDIDAVWAKSILSDKIYQLIIYPHRLVITWRSDKVWRL